MGTNAQQRRGAKRAERLKGETGEGHPSGLNRMDRRARDRALVTFMKLDMKLEAKRRSKVDRTRVPSALVVPGEEKGFEKRESGLLVPGGPGDKKTRGKSKGSR